MDQEFEQFVGKHIGRIRQIARRYAESSSVEDLIQEILFRLWRSYPGFRGESRIETWLYRVALNAAMTHVKSVIRDRDVKAAMACGSILSDATPAGADPDDLLESFMTLLGDIDASILMMYLDGLSANEMSTVLGINSNAISVRISRMKEKFATTYVG